MPFLRIRHKERVTKKQGKRMATDVKIGKGKLHRIIRERKHRTLFLAEGGGITTDVSRAIEEKFGKWSAIWKCDDLEARHRAATPVGEACKEARTAFINGTDKLVYVSRRKYGSTAGGFKLTTSLEADGWSFRELASLHEADL